MNYSDLSIVLPCKNEEENLSDVIKDLLREFGTKCEIIVVEKQHEFKPAYFKDSRMESQCRCSGVSKVDNLCGSPHI